MKIELLKAYGLSAAGEVLDNVPASVASLLVARGVAKQLDAAPENKQFKAGKVRRK